MRAADSDIHPEAAVAPGYLANHAARAFNRLVDARLRPHGVTMALIGPLLLLSWKGPMMQRDLVQDSAVQQPAMVALLRRLEAQGLIQRSRTEADRRASSISLTPAGEAIANLGAECLVEANEAGLAGFTEDERALLVPLLWRFIQGLERAHGTKHHA